MPVILIDPGPNITVGTCDDDQVANRSPFDGLRCISHSSFVVEVVMSVTVVALHLGRRSRGWHVSCELFENEGRSEVYRDL